MAAAAQRRDIRPPLGAEPVVAAMVQVAVGERPGLGAHGADRLAPAVGHPLSRAASGRAVHGDRLIMIGGAYTIQDYYHNIQLERFILPGVLILVGFAFITGRGQHHRW